ncbi:MAG: outer membrane lipoprotein carrier protein LolA [Sphingorhabdus sp.]
MNKYLATALAAPVVLLATAPTLAQKSGSMAQVVSHMKAVATMTASFTQTDRKGKSVSGKLLLKRPGHIRFQYQKGVPLLVVADGRTLTMIDYEVKQVQRWPIKNSPLAALLDPGRDLSKYGKLIPTRNSNVISVRVKDPRRPEYGTITMIFVKKAGAPSGLTLNGWVALDSKNNRTTVRLGNVKFNTPIAKSQFRWKDPRPKRRK